MDICVEVSGDLACSRGESSHSRHFSRCCVWPTGIRITVRQSDFDGTMAGSSTDWPFEEASSVSMWRIKAGFQDIGVADDLALN